MKETYICFSAGGKDLLDLVRDGLSLCMYTAHYGIVNPNFPWDTTPYFTFLSH